MRVGGKRQAAAVYPQESDPIPIVREGGWERGPVWTSTENVASTAIRFPDRPVRNESVTCTFSNVYATMEWYLYNQQSTEHTRQFLYHNRTYLFNAHLPSAMASFLWKPWPNK
jgi:hypothetical protein